jgi:uncharacterized protein YjbJ (UPF0337 family)
MNWNQVRGQWQQLAGEIKSRWGKLTDDDLQNVAGKKEQLVGKLREHYGILQQEAEQQIDVWLAKLTPARGDKPS